MRQSPYIRMRQSPYIRLREYKAEQVTQWEQFAHIAWIEFVRDKTEEKYKIFRETQKISWQVEAEYHKCLDSN